MPREPAVFSAIRLFWVAWTPNPKPHLIPPSTFLGVSSYDDPHGTDDGLDRPKDSILGPPTPRRSTPTPTIPPFRTTSCADGDKLSVFWLSTPVRNHGKILPSTKCAANYSTRCLPPKRQQKIDVNS